MYRSILLFAVIGLIAACGQKGDLQTPSLKKEEMISKYGSYHD